MLITLARKPLKGSVVQNALQHGCGALNVDGCRVGAERTGRWLANVLLGLGMAERMDEKSGILHSQDPATRNSQSKRSGVIGFADSGVHFADKGGASRFFKQVGQ